MNRHARFLGATLAAASLLVAAPACEDAAARQREAVQAALREAASDLWQNSSVLTTPSAEEVEQARRELDGVVRQLGSAAPTDKQQQATAAMLAASASTRLGAISVSQAQRVETANRASRTIVNGMIDTVVRLDLLAESLESMDASDELERLEAQEQQARQALEALGEELAALDGPIADRASANRDARDQVKRLRDEASALRRDAADRGDREGFALLEQAVEKDRAADGIDLEIGQREVELRYDLVPRHELAGAMVEQLQARIVAIDDARASLQELTGSTAAQASAARQEIAGLQEQVRGEVEALSASMGGQLTKLYEAAGADLGRAATKARSAASAGGDLATVARLEAARANQDLGDMHMQRARALADQAVLLERLGDAGAAEVAAQRDQIKEQARASYAEARQLLDQVKARSARLDELKGDLDRAISGLPQPAAPGSPG